MRAEHAYKIIAIDPDRIFFRRVFNVPLREVKRIGILCPCLIALGKQVVIILQSAGKLVYGTSQRAVAQHGKNIGRFLRGGQNIVPF